MWLTNLIITIYQMWPLLAQGLLMTVGVSFGAITIGLCGGILVGAAACKRFKTVLTPIITGYVLIIRATPVYVQVLMVYYALPELLGVNLSPISAGIVALGCCSIAYVAEIVRGGINAVAVGQWEAASVLGYSTWQTLKYIILPQAFNTIFPALVNEILAVLKDSSILSAIGLMELTKIAMNISARTLDPIGAYALITLFYLGMTSIISYGAKLIEKNWRWEHDYG